MQVFPFSEHSGKIARIVMNIYMIHEGYFPAIIHSSDRQRLLRDVEGPPLALEMLILESMDNALNNAIKFITQPADGDAAPSVTNFSGHRCATWAEVFGPPLRYLGRGFRATAALLGPEGFRATARYLGPRFSGHRCAAWPGRSRFSFTPRQEDRKVETILFSFLSPYLGVGSLGFSTASPAATNSDPSPRLINIRRISPVFAP